MSTSPLATMQDLQQRVAETVQGAFGMLIPPETFKELTNKAIEDYFYTKQNFTIHKNQVYDSENSWSRNSRTVESIGTPMTLFEFLIFNELTKIVKEALDVYFKEEAEKIQAKIREILSTPTAQGKFAEEGIPLFAKMQEYQTLQALGFGLTMLGEKVKGAFSLNGMPNTGIL